MAGGLLWFGLEVRVMVMAVPFDGETSVNLESLNATVWSQRC